MAKAWVFGDNISTDLIIPGRYLIERDPESLSEHAMEGADPIFLRRFRMVILLSEARTLGADLAGSTRQYLLRQLVSLES